LLAGKPEIEFENKGKNLYSTKPFAIEKPK
jgi:hypothetical protein